MPQASEFSKTSLLIIATIFTAIGAAKLNTDPVVGSILLLIAVGILVLRGWLKHKGIEVLMKK